MLASLMHSVTACIYFQMHSNLKKITKSYTFIQKKLLKAILPCFHLLETNRPFWSFWSDLFKSKLYIHFNNLLRRRISID